MCVRVLVCVRAHILIRDGLTLGLRAGRILLIVLCWYWFPCGKHNRKVPRLRKRTGTNAHTLYPLCPTGTQAARLDPCSHSDSLSHTYTHKHILILYKHLTQTCRGHTLEERQAPQTESDYDLPASSCRFTARRGSDLFTVGRDGSTLRLHLKTVLSMKTFPRFLFVQTPTVHRDTQMWAIDLT